MSRLLCVLFVCCGETDVDRHTAGHALGELERARISESQVYLAGLLRERREGSSILSDWLLKGYLIYNCCSPFDPRRQQISERIIGSRIFDDIYSIRQFVWVGCGNAGLANGLRMEYDFESQAWARTAE